jgi:hypothetical protein
LNWDFENEKSPDLRTSLGETCERRGCVRCVRVPGKAKDPFSSNYDTILA